MSEGKKTHVTGKRSQPEVAKVAPASRVQQARKVGPHGKQKNADGSLHSTSNPHGPTSGTR
jgi:ribosomal protein L15E